MTKRIHIALTPAQWLLMGFKIFLGCFCIVGYFVFVYINVLCVFSVQYLTTVIPYQASEGHPTIEQLQVYIKRKNYNLICIIITITALYQV